MTRTNFILALRAFEGTSPVHLEGIKINMNGNKDAYFVEGTDLSKYNSAQQIWEIESVIELSGKTTNCHWDTAAAKCA